METLSDNIINSNDEWPIRCSYWQSEHQKQIPKRKRRETRKAGLVLTGNGLSINVDRGRLIIKDGFTHYPQKAARFEFFKGALDMPPRIVIVDGNGSISIDAIGWLSEQKVDLIRIAYDGHIQSVMSANGYAADPKLVAWQLETQGDEEARLEFAVPLIKTKIEETIVTLERFLPESSSRTKAILRGETALSDLKKSPPANVGELLAIEGNVAQGYFYAWRSLDLKWKATKAYPVPDEWRQFFSRSSLYKEKQQRIRNRNATHPVNAMLNYVYAMLQGRVHIEAIAEGYDPSIGIMHNTVKPGRHSFVYDRMEPLRPIADRTVLKLVNEETFSGADFQIQANGVVRMNPELARRVVPDLQESARPAIQSTPCR
jgi:CRISPR-associated protein Cas1